MVLDFVPLYEYTHYFHLAVLMLVLLLVWQCHHGSVLRRDVANLNAMLGLVVAFLLVAYIGMRPVNAEFGDTTTYASQFKALALGKSIGEMGSDWLFYGTMHFFAHQGSVNDFFLLCAFIYVGAAWMAMVRIFKVYYYIPFIVLLSMFFFWSYGVNGVRNGVAASLVLLAISYVNKWPVMLIIGAMAVSVHQSFYMLVGAGLLAWFFKNSYVYLVMWVACVAVSYAAGFAIQNAMAALPFFSGADSRFLAYMTYSQSQMASEGVFVSTSFRWDFVAFSGIAVAVGYYFIFRRGFKDEFYHWIYNTYLTTNAFWILIIRAAYSNRFAQISWFIMPLVLIYPFMRQRFWQNQEKMLAYAILFFYLYTFYSNNPLNLPFL